MTEEELRRKASGLMWEEISLKWNGGCTMYNCRELFDQILALIKEAGWKSPEEECVWTIEDEDQGLWETTCKNVFFLSDGVPLENDMIYCCYCGSKIKS